MLGKISNFNAFAIILLNDEESVNELRLPAELDPLLSKSDFDSVCFIFSMVSGQV